ncbi:MAG TPA: G1 family glutamic endopeptidase [Trebonia sp.]|jgi:hypothetical protein
MRKSVTHRHLRLTATVIGAVAALAAPVAVATSASASSPAGTPSASRPAGWANLDCAAQQPAGAQKAQVLHPSATQKLAHGGTGYFFCQGGRETEVAEPPAGFTPRTASASELAEYGYPPKPTGGAALKTWQEAVADRSPSTTVPTLKVTDQRAVTNSHWSGYVASAASGTTFNTVEATITQPAYHAPSSGCSSGYLVSWVGLGGYSSGNLIQDGTEIDQGATYIPWYEWLGAVGTINITQLPGVTINAGDQVFIYATYESSNQVVDFYISDSDGTGNSYQASLGSGDYDGSTAEWIDERPLIDGSFPNLANYGSDPWTGAEVEDSAGDYVDAGDTSSQTPVTMTGNDGNLSVPGTLGTSSFTDTYASCQ